MANANAFHPPANSFSHSHFLHKKDSMPMGHHHHGGALFVYSRILYSRGGEHTEDFVVRPCSYGRQVSYNRA